MIENGKGAIHDTIKACIEKSTIANGYILLHRIHEADPTDCRNPQALGYLYALMNNNTDKNIYKACFYAYNLRRMGFNVIPNEWCLAEAIDGTDEDTEETYEYVKTMIGNADEDEPQNEDEDKKKDTATNDIPPTLNGLLSALLGNVNLSKETDENGNTHIKIEMGS